MPLRYAKEMLCDWISVGKTLVKTGQLKESNTLYWFNEHIDQIILHPNTRKFIDNELSNLRVIMKNPNFLKIKDKGEEMVPYILNFYRRCEDTYEHICCCLLFEILKVNPVKDQNRGNVQEMRKDWLEWNKQSIKDLNNKDLVELLISNVKEDHYSPLETEYFRYSTDECREELERRLESYGLPI